VFHFLNRPFCLFGGYFSATTETMFIFESTQAAKQSSCGNFVTAASNFCDFWFGTRPLQPGGFPAKNVKIPKNPAGERREQRGTPPRRSGSRRA
jgi:hypothetical protein